MMKRNKFLDNKNILSKTSYVTKENIIKNDYKIPKVYNSSVKFSDLHSAVLYIYFNNDKKQDFINESKECVESIIKIEDKENSKRFNMICNNSESDNDKLYYIKSYISLLNRKYNIDLNIQIPTININNICCMCEEEMEELDYTYQCSNCGFTSYTYIDDNNVNFSDSESNTVSESIYIENSFNEALMYIQGKQIYSDNFNSVLVKCKEYCSINNIDINIINPNVLMYIFKQIDYKEYHNAYLFSNILNGYQLVNIDYYYEEMMKDDNITFMNEYEKVKDQFDRKSAPDAFFRLMLIMKKYNFDVDYTMFKIPSMTDTLDNLNKCSRYIFERLGWNYIE